ncbi:Uncharacterised protein [Vibrio cholerae]|nr:Uncharacterised protein [Vibrio cholerae]CSA98725.1 Uncharacterised protein [Vibrio cholerae]CSC84269.1 Uncharacterised protein [Vibrio cholerae]CSD02055.1 Uncharacterised protein [Vibrio cholerae]
MGIIQSSRHLFTVTGDKRNGIAIVDQGDGSDNLLRANIQFLSNLVADSFAHPWWSLFDIFGLYGGSYA